MKDFRITIQSIEDKKYGTILISDRSFEIIINALQNSIRSFSLELLNEIDNDLSSFFNKNPEKFSFSINTSKSLIRKYNGTMFLIRDFKKGSIVIYGSITALSYYVLNKTLGESFCEAWKESELHKKVKTWFLENMNLGSKILENKFKKKLKDIQKNGKISSFEINSQTDIELEVYISPNQETPFLSIDDV